MKASWKVPKHILLAIPVLYIWVSFICLAIGNLPPSKAFKKIFTSEVLVSNLSTPILSNSSNTRIAFSANFIFPLHSLIRASNSSSRVVPTIPSGTKLQVFMFLNGTSKYLAAQLNVAVFPVPVGPGISIDSVPNSGLDV